MKDEKGLTYIATIIVTRKCVELIKKINPEKQGDILDVKEEYEVNDILIDNNLNAHPNFKFANKALFKLFTVIRKNQTISYYLEESTELDKVLNFCLVFKDHF